MSKLSAPDIINFIKNGKNVTATGIAKNLLGVTKASQGLKDLLEKMVDSKAIEIVENGGKTCYIVSSKGCDCNKSNSCVDLNQEDDKEISGYSIKKNKSTGGWNITTPSGKVVDLSNEQYLLVINDQPSFKVTSPKDVIAAIVKYTSDMKYVTFSVKNVIAGKDVSKHDDIILNERVIIFNIQKVNKAG